WMRGHSVVLLPPANGRTQLRIQAGVPAEVIGSNPAITVKLNGRIVDQFRTTTADVERDYRVTPAPRGLPNVLELGIERTVTPPADGRELGLRVRFLGWGPA